MHEYVGFLIAPAIMFTSWILQAWLAGRFKISIPRSVRPAAELALHIITGSVLFALVFSAAAGIKYLIDFFVQRHLSPEWLVGPTHVLEAAVWGGDVFAFLLFNVVQLLAFCRDNFLGQAFPWIEPIHIALFGAHSTPDRNIDFWCYGTSRWIARHTLKCSIVGSDQLKHGTIPEERAAWIA